MKHHSGWVPQGVRQAGACLLLSSINEATLASPLPQERQQVLHSTCADADLSCLAVLQHHRLSSIAAQVPLAPGSTPAAPRTHPARGRGPGPAPHTALSAAPHICPMH